MTSYSSHKTRVSGFVGSLIGLLAAGYFGYHAVQGERGVLSLAQLNTEIVEARQILALRKAEQAELQARVDRLSPSSLDPDLLDERARAMLNRARPDEKIILLDK
jgi:cell division protein FtsB